MIFVIANQKGGTGKSTTAAAIAQGAAFKGKKVLAIDLDPQTNLSFILGADSTAAGAYALITGAAHVDATIQQGNVCDVIGGNPELAAADTVLTDNDRVYALSAHLKPIIKNYDVIVIDTPPTFGTLTLNALAVADRVIIPLQADILSLQGLYQLTDTINNVKKKYNKKLAVAGVLFTKYSPRSVISKNMNEEIGERCEAELHIPVFNTTIREGVAIREAQAMRQSLFEHAPKSNPAVDYMQLIEELKI